MRTIRCITATRREAAALVIGTILAISNCPVELQAQAQTGAPANAASPANSPSPSNGITSGNSPIETTLFAYRALASDADAIAYEIGLAGSDKIVIGSQTDVAAFTLWREIMGEADLLHKRAAKIAGQLTDATNDYIELTNRPPQLTLNVHHAGGIVPRPDPQPVKFDIRVRNGPSPASHPTTAPVTVTLPNDWTNLQLSQPSAWKCDPQSKTCTESGVLQPNDSFPLLTITVQLTLPTPAALRNFKFTIEASATGAQIDSWQDSLAPPILSLEKAVAQGSQPGDVKFRLTVSNDSVDNGAGSTTDPVTVADTLPSGWTLGVGGASGPGWTCTNTPPLGNPVQIACTRSDALEPGKKYDPITLDAITTTTDPNIAFVTTAGLALVQSQPPPALVGPKIAGANAAGGVAALAAGAIPAISAGEAAVSTGVDILTNLASLFAVTQTLTPEPVSPNDGPLVNLVAGHLSPLGKHLYVPSVFTPNLLRNARLTDTYLWSSLRRLENDRMTLLLAIGNALSPKLPASPSVALAQAAGEIQTYLAAAKVLTANIDAFDNGLFGGQAFTQTSQNQPSQPNTQNPQQTPSPKSGGTSGNPPCPSTCTTGTCITVNCGQSSTSQDPSTQKTPQNTQQPNNTQQPTPTPAIIPQILAADLTVRELWRGDEGVYMDYTKATASDYARIKFLSLHTLESSGSQLKKSSKIVGDHLFFSGGAVATYALYNFGGDIACSGVAYDYEGNIREKNYDRALRNPQLPAILSPEIPCAPPHDRPITTGPMRLPNENDITPGMPAAQVNALLGPPENRSVVGGIAFEQFKDPADASRLIEVAIQDDKVLRPATTRLVSARNLGRLGSPNDIKTGMTVPQVTAILGPHYRSFAAKNGISIFRFDDPSNAALLIEVAFKNGKVIRPPRLRAIVGMTVDQVIAILGPPRSGPTQSHGITIYRFADPEDANSDIEIAFKDGKVMRPPAVKPKSK